MYYVIQVIGIQYSDSHFFFISIPFTYLFIYLLATPRGMWDLSSLTRDQTHLPSNGNKLNHWTAKEVPISIKG